ncbi:TonB-dependent siderophore receptor [Marinobacter persicus]|uniref:Iron complex outermembrane receptor protein n=1 Tax=Marinobacter persicus TaxID=930118 RepID=A0A2S6G2B8_9GAMM|nr:TonB-dependent siderophore receptor [Marinobacter persicus]PPK49959.1 iron complex outermembrane receptor protein [Marinobacter persicus]PPK51876.1 iron complex outermembrane receptor protein [Marinobacter persicus]PPK56543.1 iron complex outermembrane receptor protein [Marinobacter persicus]
MFQRSRMSLAVAFTLTGITGLPLSPAQAAEQPATLEALNVTAVRGATKTETPVMETPQTVNVINNEEWQERGAESVQRAANYTPGVGANQVGSSNRYDYLILRGFSDGSINNTYLDGLRVMNDGGSFSSFAIDPWYLERIEIVKGPTSVLYGQSSPGGIVALTSKKPEFQAGGEVRATLGNNAQRGFAFDFTGPVDDDRRVAYRLTGKMSAADAQQDHVEEERRVIAPSLTWDMTDYTSLTLLAYLQQDPKGGYHGGLPYEGTVESRNGKKIDNTFFEGEPEYDEFDRDMAMAGYDFEHEFSQAWTARQKFRYLESEVSVQQVYQAGWGSGDELLRSIPGQTYNTTGYSASEEELEAFTVDNQLEGTVVTGLLEHRVLVGLDYQKRENEVKATYGEFPSIDAFDPVYGADPLILVGPFNDLRELEQTGVYLQDQMVIGNWHISLGGRQDWVNIKNTSLDYGTVQELDENQFTGRAGLLYKFDNGVAPYLSYSTSFSPSAYLDENGELLNPSTGEQIETGLKYQPVGTGNLYTLSVFRINQKDLATKVPNETFYRAIGEIQSQGMELEAKAQLTENLDVQAGYAYTDVTFEKAEAYREGNQASQTPEHQLTMWTGYSFDQGILDGARAGFGVRHMRDIQANDANTRKVPNYTLVDMALSYNLARQGLPGVTARLNVNNLLDKEYIASCYNSLNYCYYGAERDVKASVSYKF